MPFGGLQRFDCIHVIIDPDIAEVRACGMGVQQREQDQVKLFVALLEIAPRVVEHLAHTR